MSTVSRWWVERTAPQRFDLYTRGSLYALVVAEPFTAAFITAPAQQIQPPWLVAFLALSVVHAAAGLVVLRGGIQWYLGSGPWPFRAVLAYAVITLIGLPVSVVAFGPVSSDLPPEGFGAAGLGFMLFTGYFVAALTPRLPTSRLLLCIGGVALGNALAVLALGWPAHPAFALGFSVVLALASAGTAFRGSVWMLGIVWELDRSRQVQTQLAVAEERLRFARDLHDVLGRNLSVIALKSELAAQLSRRGSAEASAEMMEVREIAQESLREVREVVRGYRGADLTTELSGARSVLRSAGVQTRVVGDVGDLPVDAQAVLGWVAREGTTNVLRHSTASSCVISVSANSDTVTLVMENDGVLDGTNGRDGTGLSGLDERLRHMGGTLGAQRLEDDRFRLTASVPLTPAEGSEA